MLLTKFFSSIRSTESAHRDRRCEASRCPANKCITSDQVGGGIVLLRLVGESLRSAEAASGGSSRSLGEGLEAALSSTATEARAGAGLAAERASGLSTAGRERAGAALATEATGGLSTTSREGSRATLSAEARVRAGRATEGASGLSTGSTAGTARLLGILADLQSSVGGLSSRGSTALRATAESTSGGRTARMVTVAVARTSRARSGESSTAGVAGEGLALGTSEGYRGRISKQSM